MFRENGSFVTNCRSLLAKPSIAIGTIAVAAFVLRLPQFFGLLPGDDEQFYLLVASRMAHGALPYVDIWDRKPYGLFALMSATQLMGRDGIFAAALLSTLFALASAVLIYRIARRAADPLPSLAAGLYYLLLLTAMAGEAWQAAVFYNLFLIIAVWLVLQTNAGLTGRRDLLKAGAAILFAGVAIQVKTNSAIEGAAIGLWLVVRLWKTQPARAIIGKVMLLAFLASLPTLLVGSGFALTGHFHEWFFANFQSQLLKQGGFGPQALGRLRWFTMSALPLIVCTVCGIWRHPPGEQRLLLAFWAIAAAVDAVAIGNFWAHYLHPFAAISALLAAQLFAQPRYGKIAFALFSLAPLIQGIVINPLYARHSSAYVSQVAAHIPTDVETKCMLAYEAPVIFYYLTNACLVTPYIFVDQLRSSAEAHALPEDAAEALLQALARRPEIILTVQDSQWEQPNRRNDQIIRDALKRDYTRTFTQAPSPSWFNLHHIVVWRRRAAPVVPAVPTPPDHGSL